MAVKMSTYAESSAKSPEIAPIVEETIVANDAVATPEKTDTVVTNEGNLETKVETPVIENVETNTFDFKVPSYDDEVVEIKDGEPIKQQPITSWKDAIKSVDRKELLKELGFDDFAIELNDHIAKGGKPIDYLNARAIDWNSVADSDIVLDEMKKDFPDATPTQLQRLFNKKYNQLELADDEDKEDGMLLMKADARRLKAARIANQQSFKIPEGSQQVQAQQTQQPTPEQLQADAQARMQKLLENEAIKNLTQSKRVAIKLGDKDSFNFNIDKPEAIVRAISEPTYWAKILANKQGEPDMDKLIRLTKYAHDMDGHDLALFNYGQSKGHRKEIEEGQNIKLPNGRTPQHEKTTLGKAFKNAKLSTYGAPVNPVIN
jgi:hypothetical protein